MTPLPELLTRVHAAERGPEVIAAFDYDGTLISGYSATAFYEHRIKHGQMGPLDLAQTLLRARRGIEDDEAFVTFLNRSLAAWKDLPVEDLEKLGRRLLREQIASRLRRETWRLLEAHRQMDHRLVLASSGLRFQTRPMAEELDIPHVLNTELEVVDGRLTGATAGPPLWGRQKAEALRRLAADEDADLERSFAYSNGREDIPFLEAVGRPVAVAPDADLRAEAGRRGWPVLECSDPAGSPGPLDVVRTAAFYGSFLSGVGAAVGLGVLHGSRRRAVDLAMNLGSEASLAVAGIEVDVIEGHEHLWSSRPCVFVFNHTSKMDAIVLMKLLREEVTGVAKAEVKRVPIFGVLFQLAGLAFIDRADNAQAREALAPVVEKLRSGTSLVVAPEGTRQPTPRMGPFKKGPFHIAMQAGVPVVPIVLRGVDQVQWRGSQAVRPGRVEVRVLPPMDTTDWRPETVDEHRDEVRSAMVEALDRWPGEPTAPAREPVSRAG
ncbi:MAG TPA: HAD-IB family hydrolase [Baekduia sp.]|nr:HAD-IB family hydrolase [Baekduia sp.]